jgi:hypothetical protein
MKKAAQKSDGSPISIRTERGTNPPIVINGKNALVGGEKFTVLGERVHLPYEKISSYRSEQLPKGLIFAMTDYINSDAGTCENLDIQFEADVVVTFSITIVRKEQLHGLPGRVWGHLLAAAAEAEQRCIEQFFFSLQDLTLHMVMRFEGGTVADVIDKVKVRLTHIAESAKAAGLVLLAETDRRRSA